MFLFYFSILVEYHNNLLNLLSKETNNNGNHVADSMKNVINNLSSKEISLLQIVRDNTGVITFTDDDFQWIEQLSRALLINVNDEYFQRVDAPMNFDFLYLQSYIIRTHLLFCRINYKHVIQNYQCYVRRTNVNTENGTLDLDEKYCLELNHQQLEIDWNHLKEMQMDKLYHGHHLLRKISFILKNQQEDRSQINLFEFIQSIGDDQNIRHQIQQNEIKDFQLCYIDQIRRLYENSISDFQHLFTDVSQTLRTPIDPQVETELDETFQAVIISIIDDNNVNQIQSTIKQITDLLNDLRSVEHHLCGQWARPLKEICQALEIENSILDLIPDGIKCENYVALNIHIIWMRRILQERIVNIEEKETEQWDENIDVHPPEQNHYKQTNRFRDLLTEPASSNEAPKELIDSGSGDIWLDGYEDQEEISNSLLDENEFKTSLRSSPIHSAVVEERPTYSTLFELNLKYDPLSSSCLFEEIHNQCEESLTPTAPLNKAQKLITCPNGERKSRLWKNENLFEKLRKFFETENYDTSRYIVIDKNEILVDFTNHDARLPKAISSEYFIIERTSVFSIQFHFRAKIFEYFTTSKSTIVNLINRLISDYDIKTSSKDTFLCFCNAHGETIDNVSIANLINRTTLIQQKTISIFITEEDSSSTMLCEVIFKLRRGE